MADTSPIVHVLMLIPLKGCALSRPSYCTLCSTTIRNPGTIMPIINISVSPSRKTVPTVTAITLNESFLSRIISLRCQVERQGRGWSFHSQEYKNLFLFSQVMLLWIVPMYNHSKHTTIRSLKPLMDQETAGHHWILIILNPFQFIPQTFPL